jgi:zinc/manganese transport system substrate-binding protein
MLARNKTQTDCIYELKALCFPFMKIGRFLFILASGLPAALQAQIPVTSVSTITAEIAREIGGTHVAVVNLVAPDTDPHEYQPTPGDLKKMEASRLILLTGKGLEGYLGKLKKNSATRDKIFNVGAAVPSLQIVESHRHSHHDHDHGPEDPHWWHSIACMKKAADAVLTQLIRLDPAHAGAYAQNGAAYQERLDALKKWADAKVAELPRNRRLLVTSHDALNYFARDYGFTVLAVEGISTAEQPSSKKVAELIATLRTRGVKALFAENIENPKILAEITRETGAVLGGKLYADGLGIGDAATYEGMYRHNVSTIVDALK